MSEPVATFLRPMGLAFRYGEGRTEARALVNDTIRIPGTDRIRSSVLACWADVVAGSEANSFSRHTVALTVDLTIRLVAPPVTEWATITGEILKAGRSTVFCEVRMTGADGGLFAVSHLTFQSSPRPQDTLPDSSVFGGNDAGLAAITHPEPTTPGFDAPFFDVLGIRRLGPGVFELDRVPRVMNPAGTIQGGAVAGLAEAAAESVAGPVGDLELHYLRAVRVGPGVATATAVGTEHCRVELRDPGNENRLCTLALAWPAS